MEDQTPGWWRVDGPTFTALQQKEKRPSQVRAPVQATANRQTTTRSRTGQQWRVGGSCLENRSRSDRETPARTEKRLR